MVVTATLVVTRVAGGGGSGALGYDFADIYEIAVDSQGNVYVSEPSNQVSAINMQATTQTILGVSIAAGNIAVVVGGGVPGYSGDGGPALSAKVHNPYGLACDADDNLYVCDQGNDCIRKVDTAGIITTAVGTPLSPGFSGDGGSPTACQLFHMLGVAFDAAGNMYIADTFNDKVRVVNNQATSQTLLGTAIAPGTIETVAGSTDFDSLWFCQPDVDGNALLGNIPRGVAYIQKINSDGTVVLAAGTGTPGYSGDGGPATSALIGEAFGLALVPSTPPPPLSVTPSSLSFVNRVWGFSPHLGNTSAVLNITASGSWSCTASEWLDVQPSSGTGNSTVTVSLSETGLPLATNGVTRVDQGTYTGQVEVTDGSTTVQIPGVFNCGYGDTVGTGAFIIQ